MQEKRMRDDVISRQAAIDATCYACGNDCDKSKFVYNAPRNEQVIMCPKHYLLSTLPSAEPDRKAIEDEVWDTAIKISIADNGWSWQEMTYQEAKAIYDAWKNRKDDAVKQKVITLADEIGIHKLYTIVSDMRGE